MQDIALICISERYKNVQKAAAELNSRFEAGIAFLLGKFRLDWHHLT